eukprot:2556216-Rhodomonas_salina.2
MPRAGSSIAYVSTGHRGAHAYGGTLLFEYNGGDSTLLFEYNGGDKGSALQQAWGPPPLSQCRTSRSSIASRSTGHRGAHTAYAKSVPDIA